MRVARVCAADLSELMQAAEDALRGLDESVTVLGSGVLNDDDRRVEGQRVVDEAARLWGSAQGIAERLDLSPALRGLRR